MKAVGLCARLDLAVSESAPDRSPAGRGRRPAHRGARRSPRRPGRTTPMTTSSTRSTTPASTSANPETRCRWASPSARCFPSRAATSPPPRPASPAGACHPRWPGCSPPSRYRRTARRRWRTSPTAILPGGLARDTRDGRADPRHAREWLGRSPECPGRLQIPGGAGYLARAQRVDGPRDVDHRRRDRRGGHEVNSLAAHDQKTGALVG